MFAGEVTEEQALLKAQKFMQGKQFKQKNIRRAPSLGQSIKDNAFYVFNVENNGGFVLVSSDDRMPDILGYSESGNLNPESASCNVKWLLNYYNKAVTCLKDDVMTAHSARDSFWNGCS